MPTLGSRLQLRKAQVMALKRLTFHLLKEDLENFEDAVASDKEHETHALDDSHSMHGLFVSFSRSNRPPPWVKFVQPLVSDSLNNLQTSSASGLLLFESAGRKFAVTFGYGRSLLDLSQTEHQFGLKVALNRIDATQIRSMDTKTFEDLVKSTSTQVSKSAELPTFGINTSTDILRAVTGEPRDKKLAKRLSGSDALVMNVDTEAIELPEIAEKLLAAYQDTEYQKNFKWIDQLCLVQDDKTVRQLDEALVDQLRAGDTSRSHLAMPENVDWQDIDEFQINGTGPHIYDELDLDRYLNELGIGTQEIDLPRLKRRKVSVRFNRNDDFDDRWKLYQCLVSEQRIGEKLYVLIETRWFEVSTDLVSEIEEYLKRLGVSQTNLIPAEYGEVEKSYNARLAESSPDDLLLMDRQNRSPGGSSDVIEFCDVLAKSGEIIHVKRKSQSSTLSHLFAQGTVSARTFISDSTFRQKIRQIVKDKRPRDAHEWLDLVPEGPLDRSKYCVSYVVVTDNQANGTDWLPFFSRLNLMQQAKMLSDELGFRVAISRATVLPRAADKETA